MKPTIRSLEELQDSVARCQNDVVCFLCESTADLKLLEDMLGQLDISHDVSCPFPPYENDTIIDFVGKVEDEKRGELNSIQIL